MKNKRNVYLDMLQLNKARKIFFDHFKHRMPKEILRSDQAVGRILAEPVEALISSPNFNAAAMDGISVKAENTFTACETKPQELVLNEEVQYINTGQVIPTDSNAVIMIEEIQSIANNKFIIEKPVFPWQNIRKMGEDIIATELLYTRNHEITPYCIGALISSGIYEVPVRIKPKVLIIPTGSELVDWTTTKPKKLAPGKVLETNSFVLKKMIESCGGMCIKHKIILDDLTLIENTVLEATKSNFDIILLLGGSSAGSQDYSLTVADKLGKILVHGITMMPGKPTILADVNSKPFLGIPGYPVSAIIAFEQFVRPLIRQMLCVPDISRETLNAVPSRSISSKLGIEEFLRVKLGKVDNRVIAIPLARGAGTITSITEADGIIRIPSHSEGINESNKVKVELLKPISTIYNNIMAVGSHDNSLSILADELKKNNSNLNLSSSHIGSIGGLIAIKKGICHLAGSHLLDGKSGKYNIPYIEKYLPNVSIKLVTLVTRIQGIIVPKGNPKNINTLEDLKRKDVTFVNRQKGSGTRILLDYKLAQAKISTKDIKGFSREEFTHMDVALAISNGSADVGIGIYAASKILNLSFIPLITERYDLIIREKIFYSKNIQTIMKVICSRSFKNKVDALGGYRTETTGEIIL